MTGPEGILVGRLLALHDLWQSGHISTTVWEANAKPVMRQLHQGGVSA